MEKNHSENIIIKLTKEPYASFLLKIYDSFSTHKKLSLELNKIETDISKFNGSKSFILTPDYQGFYNYIFKEYFNEKTKIVQPTYKATKDILDSEVPNILYFASIFVKRERDSEFIINNNTNKNMMKNKKISKEHLTIYNEYKLLYGLLEKLDRLVLSIINSYNSSNIEYLDEDIKSLDSIAIKHRFFGALTRREKNTIFKLLGRLRDLDEGEDYYLEALAHFQNGEYNDAIRFAKKVNPEEIDFPSSVALILESYCVQGDYHKFINSIINIDYEINRTFLTYLLQTLFLNIQFENADFTIIEELLDKFADNLYNKKLDDREDEFFAGKIIRNFVEIALEGINILDEIEYYSSITNKTDIPQRTIFRLNQLSLAISLYKEDITRFIDFKYVQKNGIESCKKEIREWALKSLINNNPDKSFENLKLAFMTIYRLGYIEDFINNIERELDKLTMYGTSAYELIILAYIESNVYGKDTSRLVEALNHANIDMSSVSDEIEIKQILSLLSKNGKIAYDAANWQYNKAIQEDYGWKDAGMILVKSILVCKFLGYDFVMGQPA